MDWFGLGKSIKQAREYLNKNPMLVAMGVDERQVAKNIRKGAKSATAMLKGSMPGDPPAAASRLGSRTTRGRVTASEGRSSTAKDVPLAGMRTAGFSDPAVRKAVSPKLFDLGFLSTGVFSTKQGSILDITEKKLAHIQSLIGAGRDTSKGGQLPDPWGRLYAI